MQRNLSRLRDRLRGVNPGRALAPADVASSTIGDPCDGDGQPPGRPLQGTYVGNGRMLVFLDNGCRLFLSAHDLSLVAELLRDGVYDAPFTRYLQRSLGGADVFVDVGANVGLFTVIAARQAWQGQAIAYEPAPTLQRLLLDNIAANWLNERCRVRPVAVGARCETRRFGFPTRMQMLGGLDLNPEHFIQSFPGMEVEVHDVEVVSLDVDLAEHDDIALVKIDVEGGESDVLRGMRGLLDRGAVRALSLEVRRDAHERNRGGDGWEALIGELRNLLEMGASLGVPDEAGIAQPVSFDEVVRTGLYSNLIIRFRG